MKLVAQFALDSQERIARSKAFQVLYLAFTLLKYGYSLYWKKDFYAAHAATLRYERIGGSVDRWQISPVIHQINSDLVASIRKHANKNPLVDSYVRSEEAIRYQEEFKGYGWEHEVRLRYPRVDDEITRQGDVLLLKPSISGKEKGAILIQYTDAFKKFVSIFNLNEVAKYYRIVLEPSTWGYCDAAILFFLNMQTDVIVQAQYAPDYEYIESLGVNLIPLRMGAGDWVDEDRFQSMPLDAKIYDLVMVASWQRIKRHELLFKAVSRCKGTVKKIALIGYPSSGRTKDDVLREAERYGVVERIDIYEGISRSDVSKIIGESKIGVMLTLREGANKGIYECFFSGVPVVISDRNIGVNREHINQYTGLTASDADLAEKITFLLENIGRFAPREWALTMTGYKSSTRRLNDALKACAKKAGEEWTQNIYAKKNDTNARYVLDRDRTAADSAIGHLRGLLRRQVLKEPPTGSRILEDGQHTRQNPGL